MNRRPGYWNGVLVALVLAFVSSILFTGLGPATGLIPAIKLTASLVGLGYLIYLVRATRLRTGRIVTFAAWGMLAALCWWLGAPLPLFLLIQVGAIWLIRALIAHSGVIPAMADAAISGLAVLTFSWAFQRTGSVLLATWCFFLIQALWVYVPQKLRFRHQNDASAASNEPFLKARRRADDALHQLFTRKA